MAAKLSAKWRDPARQAELRRLGTEVQEGRMTWAQVATAMGDTRNAIRLKFYSLGEATPKLADPPPTVPTDVLDILDLPVRPFAVPIPRCAPTHSGKWRTTVCYGDSHFPFQDDAALAVVMGLIRDIRPSTVVHLGDLVDCAKISRFANDPARTPSLQHEINLARAHLHQVSQLAPDARKVLLEGNHEDRLRKVIWDLPGASAQLAQLTKFQESVTWPSLLGLGEIGWDFIPVDGQARANLLPLMVLKHGAVVRKWSGASGHGEYDRYGKSGVSGHVHRLGMFFHRDFNGSHVWAEAGCTCDLNPQYVQDPDWQHGLIVIHHNDDGTRFHMEPLYIQDGHTLRGGQEYGA